MFGRFLCWLGWHEWNCYGRSMFLDTDRLTISDQYDWECRRCCKQKKTAKKPASW